MTTSGQNLALGTHGYNGSLRPSFGRSIRLDLRPKADER